nr:hypothetical protein CFP56_09823 [Quercus suber]
MNHYLSTNLSIEYITARRYSKNRAQSNINQIDLRCRVCSPSIKTRHLNWSSAAIFAPRLDPGKPSVVINRAVLPLASTLKTSARPTFRRLCKCPLSADVAAYATVLAVGSI